MIVLDACEVRVLLGHKTHFIRTESLSVDAITVVQQNYRATVTSYIGRVQHQEKVNLAVDHRLGTYAKNNYFDKCI